MALRGVAGDEGQDIVQPVKVRYPASISVDEPGELAPELAEIDAVISDTSWLLEGRGRAGSPAHADELVVGELFIRDPDWDEEGRLSAWFDVVKQVEEKPPTLAAAILWDAREQLEPLQRQHWLGQLLVLDFLRSCVKVRSHLTPFSVGLRDIPRERRTHGKRSNSSLPAAIELFLSRPVVSASMIAAKADITPRGALNLIAGLNVREVTGRARYRAWGII